MAQQDEDGPGFLAELIQDALSGAGRDVRITGFEGALSSNARLAQMTISDDDGIWLTLTDVTLEWTRSALLAGRIEVERLTAASLDIPRAPRGEAAPPSPQAEPFSLPDLPVSVNLGALEIARITLGAPLLGQALELSFTGSAALAGGAGEARFVAQRLDAIAGVFEVSGRFDPEGDGLDVSLKVQEAAGGLVPSSMGLPGAPSVDLQLVGAGPLADFMADLQLSTDGQERLAGQVRLAETGTVEAPLTTVTADIGGDLAPLFAPEYATFFGDAIALKVAATRDAQGRIDLSDLSLVTRNATLRGTAALGADGWPRALDITGQIADTGGAPVLLPIGGAPTRIGQALLSVQYDAAQGDALTGRFDITDLNRPDVQIAMVELALDGTMAADASGLGALEAAVRLSAAQIGGLGPDISQALGSDVTLSTDLNYASDAPLRLQNLALIAGDMRLSGDISADDLGPDLRTDLDLRLQSGDLARFAALAGQPLEGAADVQVRGSVTPVSGAFDLEIEGTSRDVAVGVAQADALLRGETTLDIAAARDAEGLRLERLVLDNAELDLTASGRLSTETAEVSYETRLREVSLVAPGVTGPLTSSGAVTMAGGVWGVDVTAAGPFGATLDITGPATGPTTALEIAARLPNVNVLVPDVSGPLNVDATVRRPGDDWLIAAQAAGVSGLRADVNGTVTGAGVPDLTVTGTLPLALARPFITPRALLGTGSFDLALRGGFGLGNVSGRIATSGAQFIAPALRIVLEDLNTTVTLNGGRAALDMSARNRGGGTLAVRGAVGLTGAQLADISVQLNGFTVADPQLYETRVDGTATIAGPLSGGLRIGGVLTLAETNIVVPATGLTSLAEIPEITHIGAPGAVQQTRRRAGLIKAESENGGGGGGAGIALDVTVNAPNRIFVRGRGLDAELGGRLRVTGTTAAPISAGAFQLIRGRLDILQERYTLEEGLIQLQGSLEPFLRFVAATPTSAGTARVTVEGEASEPVVSFTSDPEAPEEEVLAMLLFDRNLSEMSPFQAVQLASAVAALAGRGGAGIIGNLRAGLGLDDFDVTTTEDGGTAVSAGKYISDNAYTDVTVDSAGNSEVSLNLDLTPNLTARGSVGADGNSALGLFFERNY